MEMETVNTGAIAKKVYHIIRVALLVARKGFAKSKLLLDFTPLLKRTNKLAGKALHSLLLAGDFPSAAAPSFSSCKSDAAAISPREYEFSCSSSPAYPLFHLPKRGKPGRRHCHTDEAATMAAVQRVLEMINGGGSESPAVGLPGFGRSPAVGCRQLRITDSPFPVKENEEEAAQVSMAADEFIRRFYTDLKRQKSLALDSPYHGTWTS